MSNNKVIESLDKFMLYYKDKKINFNDLEKKLFEVFMYEDKDNNIYITPKDNNYFFMMFIIYCGLMQYWESIYSKGNNLIDQLKEGDILEFSKSRCKFVTREENKIKLKFADMTYTIPFEQVYKISLYKGNAKNLNKYPRNTNRGTKKTKNIMSKILDIDNSAFSKIIDKSTLIVVPKGIIFPIVDNLKIKFDDDLLNVGEVFPIAYCYLDSNYHYFKGNASKQEPIIKCISKIYNAKEIVKKDKNINSVIILQDKLNNEDIEDIIYISRKSNINKIRLIVSPLSIEKNINNENIKDKFNIINIDKEFYKKILPYNIDFLSKIQYKFLRNYANSTKMYICIKNLKFDECKKKVLFKCKNLIDKFGDNNSILKFVINARTIVKRLYSMVMPLAEYEAYYTNKNLKSYKINKILKDLKDFSNSNFVETLSDMSRIEIENILDNCNKLYEECYKSNPKWQQLESEIRFIRNEQVAIIIENKNIRSAFRKYLNKKYPLKTNITIETSNTIKEKFFDVIIYTSKLNDNYYWNYKSFNSPNHKYILFRSEQDNIKYLEKRYFKFIDKYYNSNNSKGMSPEDMEDNDFDELDVSEEINFNNTLESLIITSYIPSNENILKYQNQTKKCDFVFTFENGGKAFLTSQYNAYVLNENKEEITNKKVSKIERGDLLLFIEDIDKDLIEKVMLDLLNIDKLKERYMASYELINKWKAELKKYMKNNDIKYSELESKMKQYGVSRTGATIRSWLVNSIVGPQDKEVLKILGEITQIGILKNNYEECYEACSNIRRFQISIRKAIAKYILNSSINEDNEEIDLLIANRIEKSMSYIKRVEVKNIYHITKEVPSYLVNKIIEDKEE